VTSAELILGLVTAQRGGELVLSHYNTRALMAGGAVEVAPRHYPLMVAVHATWLIALWVFGHDQPVNMPALIFYLVLQGLRFWVIRTLGPRWTTRIIVLPGAPLVRRGPYRFVRHPNYLIVAAEIVVLPLAFGAVAIAIVFSLANLALVARRIAIEERALAPRRQA